MVRINEFGERNEVGGGRVIDGKQAKLTFCGDGAVFAAIDDHTDVCNDRVGLVATTRKRQDSEIFGATQHIGIEPAGR
jgi:hypothetical protein